MLTEIRISGLGVIEDATLDLDPGFTAVTGETGAGKTMVVTGVGMLLGARADSGLVRRGTKRARVEGRASGVPAQVAAQAEERGGDLDDDELLIARELSSEGRSRAFLGGASVPVSVLGEVSGDLVAIHGQADQWRLLQPARQRATLDTFAGDAVLKPLTEYGTAYKRHREVVAELDDLVSRQRDRLAEADLLRFGLDEIARAEPQPGEDAELAAEEDRLAYADGLRTAATIAAAALVSEDLDSARPSDVLGLLAQAKAVLDAEREHDSTLAGLADRVAELSYLAADLAGELSSYAADVDTDPARLAVVSERRSALTGLIRKYGDTAGHRGRGAGVVTALGAAAGRAGRQRRADRAADRGAGRAGRAAGRAGRADLGRAEGGRRAAGRGGHRGAGRAGDAARDADGGGARDHARAVRCGRRRALLQREPGQPGPAAAEGRVRW